MTNVVELSAGESPHSDERYALVCVSSTPPTEGASTSAQEFGQIFFADDNEHDVSVMVDRAKIWATENDVANVYVSRDHQ